MGLVSNIKNSTLGSSDFGETLKNGWTYFSGSIALKGLSIIGIPIMTNLLTPEEYGILNIFASYCTIAAVVLTLNLHVGVGRYYFEKKNDFDAFLGTSVLLPSLLLLISFLVILSAPSRIAQWLDIPFFTVFFIVPAAFASLLKGVHLSMFRAMKMPKKVRSLSIISGYLGFAIGIAFVFFHEKEGRYEGKLWAGLVMLFITGSIIVSRVWKYVQVNVKLTHIKYMLSYSLPLLPAYLSGFILAQFDRVMIGSYIGKGEAGQYSFAYNISMILLMVMTALYNSWTPKYYEYMNNKEYKQHDKDVSKLLGIISVAGCGLILFSDWIGYILGSKSFHVSLYIIPIVVLGNYISAINPIYKQHISFSKKTIYSSIVILIAGAINIVLNAIYLPIYGVIAAAVTTLISYFAMLVMTFVVAKYIIRIHTTSLRRVVPQVVVVTLACCYYYVDLKYLDLHVVTESLAKFGVFIICTLLLFWKQIYTLVINRNTVS